MMIDKDPSVMDQVLVTQSGLPEGSCGLGMSLLKEQRIAKLNKLKTTMKLAKRAIESENPLTRTIKRKLLELKMVWSEYDQAHNSYKTSLSEDDIIEKAHADHENNVDAYDGVLDPMEELFDVLEPNLQLETPQQKDMKIHVHARIQSANVEAKFRVEGILKRLATYKNISNGQLDKLEQEVGTLRRELVVLLENEFQALHQLLTTAKEMEDVEAMRQTSILALHGKVDECLQHMIEFRPEDVLRQQVVEDTKVVNNTTVGKNYDVKKSVAEQSVDRIQTASDNPTSGIIKSPSIDIQWPVTHANDKQFQISEDNNVSFNQNQNKEDGEREVKFVAYPCGNKKQWSCSKGCSSKHNKSFWSQKQAVIKHIALCHPDPAITNFICKLCHPTNLPKSTDKYKSCYSVMEHIRIKHLKEVPSGSSIEVQCENILAVVKGNLYRTKKKENEKWFIYRDPDLFPKKTQGHLQQSVETTSQVGRNMCSSSRISTNLVQRNEDSAYRNHRPDGLMDFPESWNKEADSFQQQLTQQVVIYKY